MPNHIYFGHLPGSIEENDILTGPSTQTPEHFHIYLCKIIYGEDFPYLQFVTKLLSPKIEVKSGDRKIEIINNQEVASENINNIDAEIQYGFAMRDHYIADLLDDEDIVELLHLKSPTSKTDIGFTEKELDFLKDLANVEYNLNEKQIEYCHNS
ncbi:hypothetical protein FQR65_LT17058 [Abscondita terminalis]|nr:hypothetical protein FQR65_LT17058 [Abscondita terminalis]